jgi:hypothetical protein
MIHFERLIPLHHAVKEAEAQIVARGKAHLLPP